MLRGATTSVAIVASIAAILAATPGRAQEDAAGRRALIRTGTCVPGEGDEVVALNNVVAPSGEPHGPAGATVVEASFTLAPVSLEALLAAPHAVEVYRSPGEADEPIACGEIGGPLDPQGALAIGLRPSGASGYSGVAYFAPDAADPAQTGISLFLAETGVVAPAASDGAAAESAVTAPATAPAGQSAAEPPLTGDEYVTTVRRHVALLVASLRRVDALFDDPRLGDATWTDQLAVELTLWQLLFDQGRAIAPPPAFVDFHARYVAALALLDSAADDLFFALANADSERLSQAAAKIDQAIQAIQALDADHEAAATPAA